MFVTNSKRKTRSKNSKRKTRSKNKRGGGVGCSRIEKTPDEQLVDIVWRSDNPKKVEKLLQNGANVNVKDNYGNTPLYLASFYGYTATVKILLANGADMEAKDSQGRTALDWASYNGHTEIVTILLANGADTKAKDSHGRTVLDWAIYNDNNEIVKLLINHNVAQTNPEHLKRQYDRENLAMVMENVEVNTGDRTIPYNVYDSIRAYLGGGKRKTRKKRKCR
jgi:ankyrin repeat protein